MRERTVKCDSCGHEANMIKNDDFEWSGYTPPKTWGWVSADTGSKYSSVNHDLCEACLENIHSGRDKK